MQAALLGLEWARPAAAWALVLPLVLLLAVRLLARAPEQVIGTLDLWAEEPVARTRGARAGRHIPPWALASALGLLFGALAWLGPRGARLHAERTWTLVVDRSPSMGLALEPGGARTRLDAALGQATEWLARDAGADERVRWVGAGRSTLELARGERPDAAWLASEGGDAEPEWEQHDLPGALWVTDRAPAVTRAHAGLFASGGAAIEGPIAADGHRTVLWEGGELREVPTEQELFVCVEEPGAAALPSVLERVLGAWCEARGLVLVRGTRPGALLRVVLDSDPSAEEPLALARDGWRATGRGWLAAPSGDPRAPEEVERRGEDWLVGTTRAGEVHPVLRAGSGRVRVGLRELSEPEGDPALFALSFGRLLDRSSRLAPLVVPLAEREAAGAPLVEPGEPPEAGEGADAGPIVDASLALAAALCAALAASLLARGR